MKRPLLFAAECVGALLLATAGAVVAARLNGKANRAATAEENAAAALTRIAAALERPTFLECRDRSGELAPCPRVRFLPRPSLLPADLKPIPAPDPEPCGDERVAGGWK